jgi:hypothetical protein
MLRMLSTSLSNRKMIKACLLATCGLVAAGVAPAKDNPALERFNQAITFFVGFDHGLHADIAKGKPGPTRVEGEPEFHAGLYGRAALLKHPGATAMIWYSTLGGNVDVTRPGSLSLWIRPHNWVRSVNENYFFPAKIMSNHAQLMFGRQGRLKAGRQDMIYLWARLGETKELLVGGGDSLKWKNDEWHLWVMNWRSNAVEFSIDGGPLNRSNTPVPFDAEWDGSGHSHLLVGAQDETAPYLLDELMVLNRPLDAEEIKWIYEEGMKR